MHKVFSKGLRGFTLIELLVVIAIIGILASVVLVSLNSARNRGNDAAIKANLSGIRTQAQLYYDETSNTYTGMCSDNPIAQAVAAAEDAGPGGGSGADCFDNADSWVVTADLHDDTFWCVDSNGAAGTSSAAATVAPTGTGGAYCLTL